ncbi:MAG: hypothetical protein J0H35_08970 [Rhodospirillales bacterium]|nr:hypothetical protein [Rhodospirillales bacterium]
MKRLAAAVSAWYPLVHCRRITGQNSEMNERQFPRDLRALFELGLQALLMDVDLTGLTATDVYRACHGRVPETPEMASAHERMGIRRLFEVALRSREFRTLFVPRFIAAYPEKRCLSFIHVPKSAGSDLSAHLITRFPSLRTTIIDPDLGSEAAFFAAVKDIVLESAVSEHVYIHGHNTLETYARWGAARPQDHLFTTIREPISLLVSQVNYVLTRMASPETPMAPDTAGWRSIFGVDDPARLEDRGEVLRFRPTTRAGSWVTARRRGQSRRWSGMTSKSPICAAIRSGHSSAGRCVTRPPGPTPPAPMSGWRISRRRIAATCTRSPRRTRCCTPMSHAGWTRPARPRCGVPRCVTGRRRPRWRSRAGPDLGGRDGVERGG